MPELPEIYNISQQMNDTLKGKVISNVEINQPKNLNLPPEKFRINIQDKSFHSSKYRGKWIFSKLQPDYHLLINLGMGGDLIYFDNEEKLPDEYQFRMDFTDGDGFTTKFFWFGYIHLVRSDELNEHKMTKDLGLSPTDPDFTLDYFLSILDERRRRGIKSFLMNQKIISGIGNVYVQDIFFIPKIHPLRKVSTLSDDERTALYNSIRSVLKESIDSGGLKYERDFYGNEGEYSLDNMLVAYKEGKPCPECNTIIEKIKTGSTSTYICPVCQKV